MAWYRTGTIAVTSGSKNVTGTGTAWINNASSGEAILGPDGKLYEIDSITSNTALVLKTNYAGANASGQAYAVVPTQSFIRDLAAQAAALVNSYSGIASNAGAGKFQDGAVGAPGITFVNDQDTGFYRSGTNEVTFVANGVAQFKYSASAGITFLNAAVTVNGQAVVLTNDARLTNSREWTASEVTQTEAETGTATTARKWTALRVRQAITAWWSATSTAFGRSLTTAVDAVAARLALGLGTAALLVAGVADANLPTNANIRSYYGIRYKPAIKPTLLIDWLESRFVIYSASGNSFFVTEDWNAFATFLGADLTIVRAGEQAYFNALGSMQFAAANTIQCDHDPLTGQRLGPYIGPARTAYFLYSTDVANAAWWKTRSFVTPNAYTALDGTLTARKLVESTEFGGHYIQQSNTLTSGVTYCAAFCVVAAGRTKVQVKFPNHSEAWGTTRAASFDLAAGTVIATVGTLTAAGITNLGQGRYVCYISATADATGTGKAYLSLLDAGGATDYTGDGSSGVYVLYGNITNETTPSPLIVTAGSTVTRPATTVEIGGTKFTGFYNQSEGVFEVSARLASGPTGARRLLSVTDGTLNNRNGIVADTLTISTYTATAGSFQASLAMGAVTGDTSFRLAHSYKTNDFRAARDGGNAVGDTTATVPAVDRIQIGNLNGSDQPDAYIERIAYYPRADSAANILERSKL